MSGFDLSQYETVDSRVHRWWQRHPEGRVVTHLVSMDGDEVVFRAELYLPGGEAPVATGYAHEVRGSSPVNRTSHVENCETSAVGRALANYGMSAKGTRPSREEMLGSVASDEQRQRIAEVAKAMGLDRDRAIAVLREVAGVDSTAEVPAAAVEAVVAAMKAHG